MQEIWLFYLFFKCLFVVSVLLAIVLSPKIINMIKRKILPSKSLETIGKDTQVNNHHSRYSYLHLEYNQE